MTVAFYLLVGLSYIGWLIVSNKKNMSLSRQLLTEPVAMRYGVGLRFEGIKGSLVIAKDLFDNVYCYDTRYDRAGFNLEAMSGVAELVRIDQARRWFMVEHNQSLFIRLEGSPYETR